MNESESGNPLLSPTDLTWRIRRLFHEVDRHTSSTPQITLAQYVKERGIEPVWSDIPAEQELILETLILLTGPELDDGSIHLDSLDLDPNRRVLAVRKHLGNLVTALTARQNELSSKIALICEELNGEGLTAIVDSVRSLELTQDEFRGAIEHTYLDLLRSGQLDLAQTIEREFSAERKLYPAVFSTADIPEYYLRAAFESSARLAISRIRELEPGGIELAERLIQRGVVDRSAINKIVKEKARQCLEMGEPIPAVLQPLAGQLISPEEIQRATVQHRWELLGSLSGWNGSGMLYQSPDLCVKRLKDAGVPDEDIRAALKSAYISALEEHGLVDWADRHRQLLPEDAVSQEEVRQALSHYTEKLAGKVSISEEWLGQVELHRQYFGPGQFEGALLDAAYIATYGYHPKPEDVAALRAKHPELDWETLDDRQPKCTHDGVDIRALVMADLQDPTERILARFVFDWMLGCLWHLDHLSNWIDKVRKACAMAVGLPREQRSQFADTFFALVDERLIAEGKTTREEVLSRKQEEVDKNTMCAAAILRALGMELDQVPYMELLRVRQVIAKVVRQVAQQEIEHG